jgi:hypothetical protein
VKAGCVGVFVGLESPTAEGLAEVGKKHNIVNGRDIGTLVRKIQRHGILVVGSFILGLDTDKPGIGRRITAAAKRYGIDILNTLFLTPLPGTRLWDKMQGENRINTDHFPGDWQYYTLTFPVARYSQLSRSEIIREMEDCDRGFYSPWSILSRIWRSIRQWRHPMITLLGNLSYRSGLATNHRAYLAFFESRQSPSLAMVPAM